MHGTPDHPATTCAFALVHRRCHQRCLLPLTHQPVVVPAIAACLPARLPACLPAYLPACSELREVLRPEEVHLPNGMAWDAARGLLYYVDSGSETITAYQTDEQVGGLQTDEQVGGGWAGLR